MFVFVIQDRTFDHERSFPGLSYGVSSRELFKVAPNHGKIFLAEQVVLSVEEYAEHKKEDNTLESREAKKWGLSVDELNLQEEMLSKGNKKINEEYEQMRQTLPGTNEDGEKIITGGRGVDRRGSEDIRQNKERGISAIGPEGTLHFDDESIRNQQLEYERLANQYERHDNDQVHFNYIIVITYMPAISQVGMKQV